MEFTISRASNVDNGVFKNNKYYEVKPCGVAICSGDLLVIPKNSCRRGIYGTEWSINFTSLKDLLNFINNNDEKILIDNYKKHITIYDCEE